MGQQVKIGELNEANENESAKQTLVRSVRETEERLRKEGRLVDIRIGSAFISTTSPQKYNALIKH